MYHRPVGMMRLQFEYLMVVWRPMGMHQQRKHWYNTLAVDYCFVAIEASLIVLQQPAMHAGRSAAAACSATVDPFARNVAAFAQQGTALYAQFFADSNPFAPVDADTVDSVLSDLDSGRQWNAEHEQGQLKCGASASQLIHEQQQQIMMMQQNNCASNRANSYGKRN